MGSKGLAPRAEKPKLKENQTDNKKILSQLDLPEPCSKIDDLRREKQDIIQNSLQQSTAKPLNKCTEYQYFSINIGGCKENLGETVISKCSKEIRNASEENNLISPKHSKRKLINSYFDHKSKRKFPGPAGLLNGTLEDTKEDEICHMELLSQDIDYSQNYLHKGIFESPLWMRLLQDTKDLIKVDSIKSIKQQALSGNLRRRKAETITAYIESVDRSAIDPLIVLRDMSENIKCTLHRDAWVAFSPYIVSECCALVLCNPTVLTTGSAFKKHYLNITLSNIHAVYSSATIKIEDESLPAGFNKVYEKDYTVIRNEKQNPGVNNHASETIEDSDLLDGLDGVFSDDVFS